MGKKTINILVTVVLLTTSIQSSFAEQKKSEKIEPKIVIDRKNRKNI